MDDTTGSPELQRISPFVALDDKGNIVRPDWKRRAQSMKHFPQMPSIIFLYSHLL